MMEAMEMGDDEIPSPWRTLGVFARRAGVGLVVAGAVWGAWYGYAVWRVNQKLAEYRARGEFASVEELNDPPGDGADDAFVWMEKAAGEARWSTGEREAYSEAFEGSDRRLPWTKGQKDTLRQILATHRAALEDIHRAAQARSASVQFIGRTGDFLWH